MRYLFAITLTLSLFGQAKRVDDAAAQECREVGLGRRLAELRPHTRRDAFQSAQADRRVQREAARPGLVL